MVNGHFSFFTTRRRAIFAAVKLQVVIFNHNQRSTSETLLETLSESFDVALLDSGSRHEEVSPSTAIAVRNEGWSGCWNEAWRAFPEADAIWGIGGDCALLRPAAEYRSAIESAWPFGIWSPMIEGASHSYMRSGDEAGRIFSVKFLEGIAFAIARPVWQAACPFGIDNPIGHGEDLRACHASRRLMLLNLLDGRVTLAHPPSERYDREEAKRQMFEGLTRRLGPCWPDTLEWWWGKQVTFESNAISRVRLILGEKRLSKV